MKNFFSTLLVATSLVFLGTPYVQASAFVEANAVAKISPKLIFKGSHSRNIVKAVFNNTGHSILSYSDNGELKLWDTASLKLLKTHQVNDIIDIAWLAGTDNFVVLTRSEAIFYNKNFESYGKIKSNDQGVFRKIAAFHNKDQVVITKSGAFAIYDSKGKEKGTGKIQSSNATNIKISPDDQSLVFMSNNSQKLYLYNANNLNYQREINSNYPNNTNTLAFIGKELWLLAKNGLIKNQLATGVSNLDSIKNWSYRNKNFNLIEADESYLIYNKGDYFSYKKLTFHKLDVSNNYEIKNEGNLGFINADFLKYNKAAHQLMALKSKDIYIYDLSSLYTQKNLPKTELPAKVTPSVIPEPEPEPEIKEAPVAVQAPEPEPKPKNLPPLDITISASVTEGIAPLEVTFLLNSARPKMVETTYSNIADKEQLYEGIPIAIKHTFTKPGKHSAIFAFRTAEGKIVKDSVLIEVRQESFEDYKKRMLGQ